LYNTSSKKRLRSIFETQWKDNQKARWIDQKQKNSYRKNEAEDKVRSQYATYEHLKKQL